MLINALDEKAPNLSTASRFTAISGLFYLGMGLTICAIPTVVPLLFFEAPFVGREHGLFRLVGWIMAVVGWFLWAGGRTGARSFVAATIFARLAVPLITIPLATSGVFPHMMYVFGVLDPASAAMTWRLLARSK